MKCNMCDGTGWIAVPFGQAEFEATYWDAKTGKQYKRCSCMLRSNSIEKITLRPTWDHIFMDLATKIGNRSLCKTPDRKIGCVIVPEDNSAILAMGYNGTGIGDENHCTYDESSSQIGTSRCSCVHAEMNCLTKLNTRDGVRKKLYITKSPCILCAQLIVNATNIVEVIYKEKYKDGKPLEYLESMGIRTRQFV